MLPRDSYGPSTPRVGDLRRLERDMPSFTKRASPVDTIRLTRALMDAKKKWYEAQARGDQGAMDRYHAQSDVLRSQGADEATALSMVPGPSAPSAPSALAVPSQYGGATGAALELARRAAGRSSTSTYPLGPSTGIGDLRRIEAGQATPVMPSVVRPETVPSGYPIGEPVRTPQTSVPQTPAIAPTTSGNLPVTQAPAQTPVSVAPATPAPVTQTQSLTATDPIAELEKGIRADLKSTIDSAKSMYAADLKASLGDLQTSVDTLTKMRNDLISRSEKEGKELDPATLATLDRLKLDAEEGLKRVKEEANRRGILDSGIALAMSQNVDKQYGQQRASVLSDRLQRLKEGMEQGLRRIDEQAFTLKQKGVDVANESRRRLTDTLLAANEKALARVENERRYQQERTDKQANEAFDRAVSEANLTGSYLPSNVRNLVNRALTLKRQAETPGVSQEAITGYSREADAIRSQLPAYGIDPNLVGKGINYAEAAKNVSQMGTPTLGAQRLEADKARQALTAVKPGRGAPVSDGGTPTQREKYAGIMQGAANLVNDLMTQGKYLGEQGDSGRRYIRLTPSQAAEEVVNTVRSQVGDMGLSYAELNNLINFIYQTAGVPRPQAAKPLTPKQKWENQFYGDMLAE